MRVVGEYRDFLTGEINEIREGDSVKILRKESKDYLCTTMSIDKREENDYTIQFTCNSTKLYRLLGASNYGLLSYLMQYVSYKNCELRHHNGALLTNNYITEELEISRKTLFNGIETLCDYEILSKRKEGRNIVYIMNPFICMKGNKIDTTIYEMFKNSRWSKRLFKRL